MDSFLISRLNICIFDTLPYELASGISQFVGQESLKLFMELNIFFGLQVFFSALIDVAGHAGKLETCFDLLKEMEEMKVNRGIIAYSSLMGACSNVSFKIWYLGNLSESRL